MRRFNSTRWMVAMIMAGAVCAPSLATAQDADDWEFGEDAARQLTVATVRYDGGKAVVVQCEKSELKVAIVGLPASTTVTRHLDVTRADGRRDRQGWFATPGQTVFTSTVAGRDARFLRGGGLFDLRSAAGDAAPVHATFDLPTQNANLDRVLAACGYAATDERDALQRVGDDLKTEWQAEHENDRPRTPTRSRSVSGRNPAPAASAAPPLPSPADRSCVVRAGAYADCRFDHTLTGSTPQSRVALRSLGEIKLEPVSAAANEGRAYYPIGGVQPLILIERTTLAN